MIVMPHDFGTVNGYDALMGMKGSAYPKMIDIPEEHQNPNSSGQKDAATLFYEGGTLEKLGRSMRPEATEEDRQKFFALMRAALSSWEPKHEVKMATAAWILDVYTIKE